VTTPTDEPEMDPAVARLLQQRQPDLTPERPLWREPARAVLTVATAIIAITANLPWLQRVGSPPFEVINGRNGYGDGALLAVTAIVATVIVLNRDASRSRTWLMRWLPAILGIVALTFVISAIRSMENQIVIWHRLGATGEYQPAFFICLAGGVLVAVAGGWIGLTHGLDPGPPWAPNERLAIRRSTTIWAASSLIGVFGGMLAGGALALNLGIDAFAVTLPLMVFTILGGIGGGMAGGRLGRVIARDEAR
jgi:uncharacterized membrane protein YozB (DUF420 family)